MRLRSVIQRGLVGTGFLMAVALLACGIFPPTGQGPAAMAQAVKADPELKPGSLDGRKGASRAKLVKAGGGNDKSEAAVAAGLQWLANHQLKDGTWAMDRFAADPKCNCDDTGKKHEIASIAFGLLPFLGAGETPRGGVGLKYAKTVERGLKALLLKQDAAGGFSPNMYENGLAAIALCEAYGLTADPALKGPAQKAVDFILSAQNATGGWDYGKTGQIADLSIGGWQIQALQNARLAGLKVPQENLDKVSKWLDTYAGDAAGATYGYRSPGSTLSMSAVGLLAREYLGWDLQTVGLQKGIEFISMASRMPDPARRTMYTYYYTTQVLHHAGGTKWESWNAKMRDLLIDGQDQGKAPGKAHQKGSWSSTGWDVNIFGGGRLMMTSMAILTLEVYYRHVPLYAGKN